MSKEPEQKPNRHANSKRDQTKQGIRAHFLKGREKRSVQQPTVIGSYLRGLLIQKKDKRDILILQTTDDVQYSTI